MVNEETEECIVEIYLREVNFYTVPNALFKFNKVMNVLVSGKDTVAELIKKF